MNGRENLERKLPRKRKSDFRWEYREIQAGGCGSFSEAVRNLQPKNFLQLEAFDVVYKSKLGYNDIL